MPAEPTFLDGFFYGTLEYCYSYAPILILLPLNFVTGTCKSFCFSLYFGISVCIGLFSMGKLHRRVTTHVVVSALLENLWMLLAIFFIVNHWAAFPIAMPYIVLGG